ncbi:MAG TPA: DEAD/DEAH box helicase [Candidatus Korarchaeota archaeon]|nr:DEAD/DEAH box helicase [Candidatus Korarchaeota archaeon]
MSAPLENPFIDPDAIEYRRYQVELAKRALKGNTLISLPTGLGKTVIAALVAAERLRQRPEGSVLVLAPTKPLASQHLSTFRRLMTLEGGAFRLVTGEVPPARREAIWRSGAKLFFATPHTVWNDVVSGALDLGDFALLVFDEAHRAVGAYPYVRIAQAYLTSARDGLILALTATPGSPEGRLREVTRALGIREVVIKTRDSSDVRPYVAPLRTRVVKVSLPDRLRAALELLRADLTIVVRELAAEGLLSGRPDYRIPLRELLTLRSRLSAEESPDSKAALARVALAIKLRHLIDVVSSQGPRQALAYLERLTSAPRRGKSDRMLLDLPSVKKLPELLRGSTRHPKLDVLKRLLRERASRDPSFKAIVFVSLRDTANLVLQELTEVEGVRPAKFYGQASRAGERGMSQADQRRVLEEFSAGIYNVLVATNVAEEGLDIPEVDLVVFYDPVSSAIRHVQRKGRTARGRPGEVVVLLTEGAEEWAFWRAARGERQVTAARPSTDLTAFTAPSTTLQAGRPAEGDVTVVVDTRELQSEAVRELALMPDVKVSVSRLEVGDFVLSDRVAVERKTVEDLAASLVDGRIFEQIHRLREVYEIPILLIEGRDPYRPSRRGVSPRSLMGLVSSLAIMGVPVLWARDHRDTAQILRLIARREQLERRRRVVLKSAPAKSLSEDMERVLSSIPGVGPETARKLLKRFGSLIDVFNADRDQLMEVRGVGRKLADFIYGFVRRPYGEEEGEPD